MFAALYALAGALIGVVGAALADAIREKRELRRRNQEELRSICSDFTSQMARVRRYLFRLMSEPGNEEIWKQIEASFTEARAHYERLLITAELVATQEAARHVLHFAYWMIHAARTQSTGYEECREELVKWLEKLYTEVRQELNLRNPENVYWKQLDDPPAGIDVTKGLGGP